MFHVKHSLADAEAREHPIQHILRVDPPGHLLKSSRRQPHILRRQFHPAMQRYSRPAEVRSGLFQQGRVPLPRRRREFGAGQVRDHAFRQQTLQSFKTQARNR